MNAHVPLKHQQKKGTKDHLNKTVLCLVIGVWWSSNIKQQLQYQTSVLEVNI